MALLSNQKEVQLDTLYEVRANGFVNNYRSLVDSVCIKGGSIDIYGIDSATQPALLSDLQLDPSATALSGTEAFEVLNRYVVFKQNSGTTTSIVINAVKSLKLTDLGVIA